MPMSRTERADTIQKTLDDEESIMLFLHRETTKRCTERYKHLCRIDRLCWIAVTRYKLLPGIVPREVLY